MNKNSWLVPIVIVVAIVIGTFYATYTGQQQANEIAGQTATQPVVQQAAAVVQKRFTGVAPNRFTGAKMVKFSGQVEALHIITERNDKVHIVLRDGNGALQQISVAPDWFLKYIRCPSLENVSIRGKGFIFDNQASDALIYAKKIWIGKTVCRLRNDEGFSFWSDRLR